MCLIAQERYVHIPVRNRSMKLFKCLAFGQNFENMDYFVCFLDSGDVELENMRSRSHFSVMSFPPVSIYLLYSRSLSLPNVVDTFICTFYFRAALD